MIRCLWRAAALASIASLLAGCGNKETRAALDRVEDLKSKKQYREANDVLLDAMQARENKVRAAAGAVIDSTSAAAVRAKVQADSEFLRMERAQLPLYLYMGRADMASEVDTDLLAGDPHDSTAVDLLRDKDPVLRIGAAQVLGLMRNADTIDALAGAARDSDQDVRRAAVAALAAIKDARAVPPLISELKDPYWFARSEAAEGLALQHDARSVQPLLDAVADDQVPNGKPDPSVQSSVESALVQLAQPPNPVAKPDDFASRLTSPNPRIQLVAAICLAIQRDPRAVPVLLRLAGAKDQQTRLEAVEGLGDTGDPSVLPVLRQNLKDPDVNMRGWSIIGLAKLKDAESIIDLQDIALDEKEPQNIRATATDAILRIKKATGETPVDPASAR
jgi:HEAT repeat protein